MAKFVKRPMELGWIGKSAFVGLLILVGFIAGSITSLAIQVINPVEADTQQPMQELTNLNPPPAVFTLVQLKGELDADPQGYGYSSLSHFEAAAALNLFRAAEIVTRATLSVQDLQSQVLISEFISLTNVERAAWLAVLTASSDGGVDISNQAIRDQAAAIWTAGTATRANLVAIQTRSGTRAEALFGEGFRVTDKQVDEARLLP